jgi:cytidyltransferase-like protein
LSASVPQVIVTGGFDDIRSSHIRLLEEASKLGELNVLMWNDATLRQITGKEPKFTEAERLYFLRAVRFVRHAKSTDATFGPEWQARMDSVKPAFWVAHVAQADTASTDYCKRHGIAFRTMKDADITGFPVLSPLPSTPGRKKVIVTGCYDWLHSGHVRFFEEVSEYGDLYVVVGNDANVRTLKGPRNPMHSEDERRYVVGSIGFVKEALVSTGQGWLDAEPEIHRLKPDIYAVNEDGDRGGKREFCEKLGIEFLVLKRTPAPGLPKRSSTDLRGY